LLQQTTKSKKGLEGISSKELVRLQKRTKHAEKHEIEKELMVMGKLLNIPIEKFPDNSAFTGWIAILSEYPIDLIQMATRNVIKTHKYPTFPMIADLTLFMDELLQERRKDIQNEIKRIKDQKFIDSL
jgi:hypothetical protein